MPGLSEDDLAALRRRRLLGFFLQNRTTLLGFAREVYAVKKRHAGMANPRQEEVLVTLVLRYENYPKLKIFLRNNDTFIRTKTSKRLARLLANYVISECWAEIT